jgi:hypothetical protein
MLCVSAILNAIPQVHIGAEMVTEVTSDLLLHFLVGSAVAAVTTATIFSLFPHGESHVDHVGLRHAPCPGHKGEEVVCLHVDESHSFRLSPNRGRDLPVANSGGLPTPGTDFDLVGRHGNDVCDWKLWKEPVCVPLASSR